MHVIQAREIRLLMRELGVQEIKPDLALRGFIELVDPFRSFDVQHAKHRTEAGSVFLLGR
jgi:hypothetical protein